VQSSIDQQQQQQMQSNIVCLPTTTQPTQQIRFFSLNPYFKRNTNNTQYSFLSKQNKTLPMCFLQTSTNLCVCAMFFKSVKSTSLFRIIHYNYVILTNSSRARVCSFCAYIYFRTITHKMSVNCALIVYITE